MWYVSGGDGEGLGCVGLLAAALSRFLRVGGDGRGGQGTWATVCLTFT